MSADEVTVEARYGWRMTLWFLLVFVAVVTSGMEFHHVWPAILASVALAWTLKLPEKSTWLFWIGVSVVLPYIYIFIYGIFMLYAGCGIWNSIAHHYMCGL